MFGHWRTDGDSAQNQAFQSGVHGPKVLGGFDNVADRLFVLQVNQQPAAASSMEKSSVLFEIRKIRGVRERLAAQNPGDQLNLAQITTLTQACAFALFGPRAADVETDPRSWSKSSRTSNSP